MIDQRNRNLKSDSRIDGLRSGPINLSSFFFCHCKKKRVFFSSFFFFLAQERFKKSMARDPMFFMSVEKKAHFLSFFLYIQ